MIVSLVAAALFAAASPCEEVTSTQPDPAVADVYLEVARAEAARGSPRTAAAAFREALSRAPDSQEAAAGLAAACLILSQQALLQQAADAYQAARHDDALSLATAALALGEEPSASLIAGLSSYALGEDTVARGHLEQARNTPALAESASLYLGLLALRRGDGMDAVAAFRRAEDSADERVRDAAQSLARTAHAQARLSVRASAEGEYNSNVTLLPDSARDSRGRQDVAGITSVAANLRPISGLGAFVRVGGLFKKQAEVAEYDFAMGTAAAGWQQGFGPRTLRAEYAYEASLLGGTPWLMSHQGTVEGRWAEGPLGIFGAATARADTYLRAEFADFSGVTGRAAIGLEAGVGPLRLSGGWRLTRTAARTQTLSFVEHGPFATAVLRPEGAQWRVVLQGGAAWRSYDARDPDFAAVREDVFWDGAAAAEWELAERWTIIAGASYRSATSNIASLSWTRATAFGGVRWHSGIF